MVIDAMMVASMVRPYMEEIRHVTDKPIRYVVNTHHHVDHSFGNQFYLPTEVVSHRGCREALIDRGADVEMLSQRWPQYREDWVKTRLTPASITYDDKMVVHLGDRVIELLHPGPAHTYGDTLVYLPQEKVLFTGDVAFHYLTPLAADGHLTGIPQIKPPFLDIAPAGIPPNIIPHSKGVKCGLMRPDSLKVPAFIGQPLYCQA